MRCKIPDKYKSSLPVSQFVRRLAIRILLASEEHGNLFKMYTPTERYRYIEKNNPRLLQRVSLTQIASYLGIARETLSRIRAKNAWVQQKQKKQESSARARFSSFVFSAKPFGPSWLTFINREFGSADCDFSHRSGSAIYPIFAAQIWMSPPLMLSKTAITVYFSQASQFRK